MLAAEDPQSAAEREPGDPHVRAAAGCDRRAALVQRVVDLAEPRPRAHAGDAAGDRHGAHRPDVHDDPRGRRAPREAVAAAADRDLDPRPARERDRLRDVLGVAAEHDGPRPDVVEAADRRLAQRLVVRRAGDDDLARDRASQRVELRSRSRRREAQERHHRQSRQVGIARHLSVPDRFVSTSNHAMPEQTNLRQAGSPATCSSIFGPTTAAGCESVSSTASAARSRTGGSWRERRCRRRACSPASSGSRAASWSRPTATSRPTAISRRARAPGRACAPTRRRRDAGAAQRGRHDTAAFFLRPRQASPAARRRSGWSAACPTRRCSRARSGCATTAPRSRSCRIRRLTYPSPLGARRCGPP